MLNQVAVLDQLVLLQDFSSGCSHRPSYPCLIEDGVGDMDILLSYACLLPLSGSREGLEA